MIAGRRTSMRLEEAYWSALQEVARKEEMSVSALCSRIEASRGSASMTSATRVFLLDYFRRMASAAD